MCCGIIGMVPTSNRFMNGPNGFGKRNSTVWSSSALMLETYCSDARSRACVLRKNLSTLKTTSFAVNGLPSCHNTPFFRVNVYTVESWLTVHDVARLGNG